jgi:AraC-like DNA-binding protein
LAGDGKIFGFEEWLSFARPFFDVIPIGRSDAFRARATSRRIGRLIVSDVGFDAAIFIRDPVKLKEFDTEFLLLETYDRGNNRGRSGDLVTSLDTHAIHVFDMARPWRTQSTSVACRSVVIPYDVIGYDPSRQPAYARLPADSPRNAMLLAGMGALFDAGPDLEAKDEEALCGSFAALVKRLMFNQRDREVESEHAGRQGLFLRRYIDERLGEPDLGPQRVCDALGVSRSALYRMFSQEGGVRRYIIGRRLDRCFDELRQRVPKRGLVSEVAERWGFLDAKSFNRAFRGRFGIAPSDCLDRPIETESGSLDENPVQAWMRLL